MKKIVMLIVCVFMICCLTVIGCDTDSFYHETLNVSLSNNQNICLQRIKDTIYYDTRTSIVYFWNGYNYSNAASMPSPYYAPNGLPYKWDPITEKLEEIDRME